MSRDSRKLGKDSAWGRKRKSEDVPRFDDVKRRRTGNGEGTDKTTRPIGFKELENICREAVPETGILGLVQKAERFEALLTSEEIRPDLLKLVISAFRLLCSANSLTTGNAEKLLRSPAAENFITGPVLSTFVKKMPFSEYWKDESDRVTVLNDLAEISLALIQRLGEKILYGLPLPELSNSLDELKEENLIKDACELEKKLQQVKELKHEVIRRAKSAYDQQSGAEPPQNFRELSVIPQAADLCFKPFLRENIVDRKFKDLDHYLDVQFRLLKEDFVMHLRDGIKQLTRENNSLETSPTKKVKRADDVSVYSDVTVLHPVCNRKGQVYRIRFNPSHPRVKRVNWERSKRLKFGSLVCLSSDDFNTLLVFATVENRRAEGLSVGELDVRFENVTKEEINVFVTGKERFVMIESSAYFEAYRHVLEALKEIKPEEFPFQKHIVECCREVGPPAYQVQRQREDKEVLFNFTGVLTKKEPSMSSQRRHSDTVNSRKSMKMSPTSSSQQEQLSAVNESSNSLDVAMDVEVPQEIFNWPDRKSLGFNESQMRAFKLALTKEFAVIQGPPGTGKTYVGLKIAQALLQNTSFWQNRGERSPILMVSYTNHALDQFLEGLLPMHGIVRVGGRSKSEKLKSHSLVSIRRQPCQPDMTIRKARNAAKRDIRYEKESYRRSSLLLEASRSSILSMDVFSQHRYIRRRHYAQFTRNPWNGSVDEELLKWLYVQKKESSQSSHSKDVKKHHERDDFQMEFEARGFSFDNRGVLDKDDNAVRMGLAVLSWKDATNSGKVRQNLISEQAMSDNEERGVRDIYRLPSEDRWRLYRLWRQRLVNDQRQQLQICQVEFEEALARDKEVTTMEEYRVLQKARVIGMTTTCAGRYRTILQKICPKIILVEEAAEVLEAHIITSLTKGCQHLILIGDHLQLRPTPAVYELATKYKLDVSLFERMVNVGIQCERLSVQHRMRPEIAALMKHIYDDLENHESVEKYEDIKGMKKNMFFISHSHLEESCDETHSHVNEHEAQFLVALCRYLLQQGYSSNQITLLTTYTGQMFAIRNCLQATKSEELEHVRLTTVDNFQGEESDIILLSLVRSNKDEKVGFIKVENRACVALSRAKKGFYCIGNFDLLSEHSDIWSKIVADLKASGNIGNALPFSCQIHQDEMTAETAEDFREKAPDGGCQQPCGVRLKCGHACRQLCHPRDTKHKNYPCGEPCGRTIKGCDHLCSNPCSEPCITRCLEMVDKVLPGCGHILKMKCSADLKDAECKERCDKILSCGHRCQNYCTKPCATECKELVKKTDWPCGHEVTIACAATSKDCPVPCDGTLDCGHQCSGHCGECRMGRIHKGCTKKCKRVLFCSHGCKERCSMPCPPCSKACENRCTHSNCDQTCGEPCIPCRYPCPWECQHHKCYKQCHEICDRPRCDEPCVKILECYHVCRGLMCEAECICAICTKQYNGDPITEIFLGGEADEDARFIRLPDCKHIFAVSDLDRYMDMSKDANTESHAIQMKACPLCSTPIRTSLRYRNVINQQLQDVEKVKLEMWRQIRNESGGNCGLKKTKRDLAKRLDTLEKRFGAEHTRDSLGRLKRAVDILLEVKQELKISLIDNKLTVALVENKVMLMERLCFMREKVRVNLRQLPMEICKEYHLESDQVENELCFLERRFMSIRVTQRELRDINTEFSRLNLLLEYCLLRHDIKSLALELDEPSSQMMTAVQEGLSSGKRIVDEELDKLLNNIVTIRNAYPDSLNQLTPEEKKKIVSVIGLSKGHWFKCPKGHIYCIGECGGAMQRSTCPKCGAVIGGANHRLEEGNELAPEMDGASHAAWSEQANLRNYGNLQEIVQVALA
ncbi:NFX1-type zinc finger-containing protein 1-like isoform X1 [Orbicella faveolata]|uniref:NFX1-type zinc finger-containing protein 1-like isoform X1 n=1 Tax=Orbicella faveolata TaxID=48498 RepID=UPI0009E20150|nr:NFX1-type zinc finger-containing protein 1-like isoform X1 [Orbicella faveolata]